MKLEDQVCSVELALKLRELGVKQESYFYWYKFQNMEDIREGHWLVTSKLLESVIVLDEVSAFSVAELGEMIPLLNGCPFLQLMKGVTLSEGILYASRFDCLDVDNSIFVDKYPSNSVCKMIIYLIENNFVTVEEINQRMSE